eukprot:405572_1
MSSESQSEHIQVIEDKENESFLCWMLSFWVICSIPMICICAYGGVWILEMILPDTDHSFNISLIDGYCSSNPNNVEDTRETVSETIIWEGQSQCFNNINDVMFSYQDCMDMCDQDFTMFNYCIV